MDKIKNFLSVLDLNKEEIYSIFEKASYFKKNRLNNHIKPLTDKKIGMIFEKSSTRTRVSFEVGIIELGGSPLFMSSRDLQLGRGEPIKDTARVLAKYLDGVVIRTFGQDRIEEFADFFEKPVINGLTDMYHPAQILADLFTVYEIKKDIKKLKVAYFGDPNNMANSWINLQAIMGFKLVLAIPEGFKVNKVVEDNSKKYGGSFEITHDTIKASENADVVTTDVFISMGQESDEIKINKLRPYIIDESVISSAKDDVIVLHCLPAHRNEEIAETVFEKFSKNIFDEAENRLHVQKAIMEKIFV
ncbi:MAG: ornithine carbamoyltransferase [bacterium]